MESYFLNFSSFLESIYCKHTKHMYNELAIEDCATASFFIE